MTDEQLKSLGEEFKKRQLVINDTTRNILNDDQYAKFMKILQK